MSRVQEDGYLVLKGMFPDVSAALGEAEALAERIDLLDERNLRCRWQTHVETGHTLLDALDPVIDISPAIHAMAKDSRLVDAVAGFVGEPVQLFKDKLLFKQPGALGHACHQDYISWPSFPLTFTTALVALDAATEENGCLEVFAGCHRDGYLSPQDGDFHDLSESLFPQTARRKLLLEPGDVAIFGCWLPHGSGPNRSKAPRRHLYLSYCARSEGDLRRDHYREFHAWLEKRYREYGQMELFFR